MVSFRNRLGPTVDSAVERTGRAPIPTEHGEFTAFSYRDGAGNEHIACVRGELAGPTPDGHSATLVRVHSECVTGDVLGSRRCDCGSQLARAIEIVATEGGIVIYVRGHEGRGIGLGHKLQAYELQDKGLDTVDANEVLGFPADARDYGVAASILIDLGVSHVRLLSNNPLKSQGLQANGITVTEQIPLAGETTRENLRYLQTKRERLHHPLEPLADPASEESA